MMTFQPFAHGSGEECPRNDSDGSHGPSTLDPHRHHDLVFMDFAPFYNQIAPHILPGNFLGVDAMFAAIATTTPANRAS